MPGLGLAHPLHGSKRAERHAEARGMDDRKQGGMTGATGNLTPDEPDEAFVPAETREMSDPLAARQLTEAAHRRAEDRLAPDSGRAPFDRDPVLGGDELHDPEEEHL
jgi:hypothetical protein